MERIPRLPRYLCSGGRGDVLRVSWTVPSTFTRHGFENPACSHPSVRPTGTRGRMRTQCPGRSPPAAAALVKNPAQRRSNPRRRVTGPGAAAASGIPGEAKSAPRRSRRGNAPFARLRRGRQRAGRGRCPRAARAPDLSISPQKFKVFTQSTLRNPRVLILLLSGTKTEQKAVKAAAPAAQDPVTCEAPLSTGNGASASPQNNQNTRFSCGSRSFLNNGERRTVGPCPQFPLTGSSANYSGFCTRSNPPRSGIQTEPRAPAPRRLPAPPGRVVSTTQGHVSSSICNYTFQFPD